MLTTTKLETVTRAFTKWWMELVQYLIVVGALEYVAQKTNEPALRILAIASLAILFVYLLSYFMPLLVMLSRPLAKWVPLKRDRAEQLVSGLMYVPAGLGSGVLMTELWRVINTIASNH
jgi:hypothetical protein